MQGLPGADIRTTVEGMAPKLDVFLNGSTVVNLGRAEQCGSVSSAPAPTTPQETAAWDIHRLTPAEVKALRATSAAHPERPEVDFSLFVQLQQDLDPEVRAEAVAAVRALSNRARFKQDAAAIEVPGANVRALHGVRGLSYVEPGEALSVPDPVVGSAHGSVPAVSVAERQVTTEARQHRYGRDVLVGIIDVGGFDFAHPDFAKRGGGTRWVAIWDQGGAARPSPAAARPSRGRCPRLRHRDRQEAHGRGDRRGARAQHGRDELEPQSTMVGRVARHPCGVHRRGQPRRRPQGAPRRRAGGLPGPSDPSAVRASTTPPASSTPSSTCCALAAELGEPTDHCRSSINISLGTNGHAHDTSSAMARWIDNALAAPGRCVSRCGRQRRPGCGRPSTADRGYVLGRIHAGGTLAATDLRQELGWIVVGDGIADLSENEMEIWYSAAGPLRRSRSVHRVGSGSAPSAPVRTSAASSSQDGTVLSVHNETYHPAQRRQPHLHPALALLRSDRRRRPFGGTDHCGGVARSGSPARSCATGATTPGSSRDDPHRRPGSGPRQQWDFPSFFAPGAYTADRMIGSLACAERVLAVANVDLQRTRRTSPPAGAPPATAGPSPTSPPTAPRSSPPEGSIGRSRGSR